LQFILTFLGEYMCETMLRIRDIMCKKVVTAKEDTLISDAIMLLNERHVGSVIVINEEQRCVGIFTERDAIRMCAQKAALDQPIRKVMSSHVVTISLEASYEEAKTLMLSHKIRHLPVTDETGKLIGLFSLRAFLDEIHGISTPIATAT
jgi:CBS domain-containing protein